MVNDIAIHGGYVYITDTALTTSFTPQPALTKVIRVNLNDFTDIREYSLTKSGFTSPNGINLNKNNNGFIVVDFYSSLIGFFDLDLKLQRTFSAEGVKNSTFFFKVMISHHFCVRLPSSA